MIRGRGIQPPCGRLISARRPTTDPGPDLPVTERRPIIARSFNRGGRSQNPASPEGTAESEVSGVESDALTSFFPEHRPPKVAGGSLETPDGRKRSSCRHRHPGASANPEGCQKVAGGQAPATPPDPAPKPTAPQRACQIPAGARLASAPSQLWFPFDRMARTKATRKSRLAQAPVCGHQDSWAAFAFSLSAFYALRLSIPAFSPLCGLESRLRSRSSRFKSPALLCCLRLLLFKLACVFCFR
jgi:hypothetical protein